MKNFKFTLSPNQEINLANRGLVYQNGKAVFNKETETDLKSTIKKALRKDSIFYNNKTLKENILNTFIFAITFMFCSTFLCGIIILITNFLK